MRHPKPAIRADPAIDASIGYVAIHETDGDGRLPLLDKDVDFRHCGQSLAREVADVRRRRQGDGSTGGDPAPSEAEPVHGISFGSHISAASQCAGRAVAATLRRGIGGGEAPEFNFACPAGVASNDDEALVVSGEVIAMDVTFNDPATAVVRPGAPE